MRRACPRVSRFRLRLLTIEINKNVGNNNFMLPSIDHEPQA